MQIYIKINFYGIIFKDSKYIIIGGIHMKKDADIVNRIKKELRERMQLSSMDINVDSKEGNIILSGIVDVLSEKIFAEEIASKIEGVVSVENGITIGMDSNITDSHIKYEIENKIYEEEDDSLSNVGVDVKGGTAILMGHVENSPDKRKAVELASSSRGVANVVDSIKLKARKDEI